MDNLKIGFFVQRLNYYKIFGSIIDYLLSTHNKVIVFHDYSQPAKGAKWYLFPDVNNIPHFQNGRPEIEIISNDSELSDRVIHCGIQAVLFVNFNDTVKALRSALQAQKYKCIICHVQNNFDILPSFRDLSYSDVVYVYSDYILSLFKEHIVKYKTIEISKREDVFKQIDKKLVPIGFPDGDQVKTFNKAEILSKYNLPANKKIVTLLSFPWETNFSIWTQILYRHQWKILKFLRLLRHKSWCYIPEISNAVDDYEFSKAIRKFADNNNALFIIKSRIKNKTYKYQLKMADAVFVEGEYYPFSTLELLFISDLCIHFYSMGVLENAFCKKPAICVAPKREALPLFVQTGLRLMKDLDLETGCFFNTPGVNYHVGLNDFVSSFSSKTFADYPYNESEGNKFVAKFLGYCDSRASERLLEDLLKRIR